MVTYVNKLNFCKYFPCNPFYNGREGMDCDIKEAKAADWKNKRKHS